MSFTYSGDLKDSQLDVARFALGDTIEETATLQDEEILYILDISNSWTETLAKLFRHAATIYGARPAKRTLGPQSEDSSARIKYFADMADKYEKALTYAGVPPLPTYQSDKIFDKNMMSNSTTTEVEE